MQHNPNAKNYYTTLPSAYYKGESKILYFTNTLRTFAESLVGIYIPIFLFLNFAPKLANVSSVSAGFIGIFSYYFFRSIIILILLPTLVNLIFGKFNFKGSIILSNIFLGIGIFLLGLSQFNKFMILPAIFLLSLNGVLYWIPYHTFFIRKAITTDGTFGEKVSIRQVFDRIASVSGPLVGAIVLYYFNFPILFSLGFTVLLISGIPLLYAMDEHKHGKHNAVMVIEKYIKNKDYHYDTIAFAAMGMDSILFYILSPMLIYFAVNRDIEILGVVTSVSIAISITLTLRIGKLVDKKGPELFQRIGVVINTTLYIIRSFVTYPFLIFGIDIIDRSNNNLLSIPFISSMYKQAKNGRHESDFVIYRTYVTEVAIAFATGFAMVFLYIFGNWQYLFLFLAAIAPLTYAINAKKQPVY